MRPGVRSGVAGRRARWGMRLGMAVLTHGVLLLGSVGPPGASAQVLPLSGPGDGADWVLDQEDLRGFEPLSLEDIIRHLVGVAVSRRGALGSLEYLDLGGSPSGRILLGLDGIEFSEPELAFPRLYAIPIALVDRVLVSWSTDPARIEVWTRRGADPEGTSVTESTSAATTTSIPATTAIDLGRGDLGTRVRRLQFLLPPRAWWVGARYDELLRGQDDFRSRPTQPPASNLGAYDGRGRLFALGFGRGNGETLRLVLSDFFDNSYGSYADTDPDHPGVTGSSRVLGSLRWRRPVAHWGMVLDLSEQAWDRTRELPSGSQKIDETVGSIGVDLTSPSEARLHGALRLRAASVEGKRQDASDSLQARYQRYDAELQFGGRGAVAWNGWVGVHEHSVLGSDWSARLRLELRHAFWAFHLQGGRGTSFAGWGEERAPGDGGKRPALYGSAGIRRDDPRWPMGVMAFAKRLDEAGAATLLLFPELGSGPLRVAGGVADAGLQALGGRVHWGLEARVAWVPYVEGDQGGLPEGQASVLGHCGLVDLFDGDLSITLRLRWRMETRRPFGSGVELAGFSKGDARLDLRILQHLLFYWDVDNLADATFEIHPDVLDSGRTSLIGVRVDLFD